MDTFRIGTSAYASANTELMKQAPIGWVRQACDLVLAAARGLRKSDPSDSSSTVCAG
jgi:hypothetical protein